jgi:hypothetical protein
MKYLKKINEGWFHRDDTDKIDKKMWMFKPLSREIEKDPKVQEIINKIKNKEFVDIYIYKYK